MSEYYMVKSLTTEIHSLDELVFTGSKRNIFDKISIQNPSTKLVNRYVCNLITFLKHWGNNCVTLTHLLTR